MEIYSQLGNYSEAIAHGEKAVLYTQDKHLLSVCLSRCAGFYGMINDYDNVDRLFSLIDSVYYSDLSAESKFYYLSSKGSTLISCEKYDLAIKALNRSIEIASIEKIESNSELEIIYHNLGRAYMLQSDYDEALKWLYKSRDIQKSINGSVTEKTANYIKECETKL